MKVKNKKTRLKRKSNKNHDGEFPKEKEGLIKEFGTQKKQGENEEEFKYIYVYGIVNNSDIELGIKGLKNKPIEKIVFKDIAALVSSYPDLQPILREEEAMQHADTLKNITKKTTVIPTSFGTVFLEKEILETVLSKSYQAIKEALKLIDGKIELGVKAVKTQLDIEYDGAGQEILEFLNKLSVKSAKGDNFSDRLLLNYSFLVEKNKFLEFSEAVAKLEEKHKNLKFIYTGPWPAYSFVNIKITGGSE